MPQAEKKFLAGVSAQYESEVVYESISRELRKQGVLFCDMDTGLKRYPKIIPVSSGEFFHPSAVPFRSLQERRREVSREGEKTPAKRPEWSALLNTKLPLMRPWQEALGDYLKERPT